MFSDQFPRRQLTIGQKRKAQNRAAQRAFRERKEKHLKDLETKVEDLEKASESANHENGLLRAQVERLQVELKEYRKRLSWVSANGIGRSPTAPYGNQARNNSVNNQNDFQFEFPKFGDLPAMSATNLFNSPGSQGSPNINPARSATLPNANSKNTQSGPARQSFSGSTSQAQQRQSSTSQSPISTSYSASPQPQTQSKRPQDSVDSLTGLFSPSILEASRHAALGGYFPQNNFNNANRGARASMDNNTSNNAIGVYTNSTSSNSDSPGSSSESHNAVSSIGTSPEPSLSSPGNKLTEYGLNTINEENQVSNFEGKDYLCEQLQKACGCADDPIPPIMSQSNKNPPGNTNTSSGFDPNSFNWLAQQNSNGFDPILFGDYRETQDNILSQDFGSFFNDAYPLPDLGSPLHNYNDLASDAAPKPDVLQQAEAAQEGVEEVVPDNDKPMTCNKIWLVDASTNPEYSQTNLMCRDRLQSMEKFRNGEIDIDNLCSELRAKAKCSEGGAVVDKKDVDKILGMAK